jgi:hypothetical protein
MRQAPGKSNDRAEKLEQGLKTLHPIIKNGAAFAAALETHEQFDPQKVAGLLIPDQSTLDKAMATGNMARISPAVLARQTDWNGLTPQQEREKEEERLSRRRQEQALAEAEYEQTMEQVREKADRLMTQLEQEKRETLQKLAEADARAIVLPDGRRVLVGGKPGEFIAEDTGKTLEGDDKAKAQGLQKPGSETAAEQKALKDRLIQIGDAEEHVQNAKNLASQNDKNLEPDEKKQLETQAKDELAKAAAISDDIETKSKQTEADAGALSTLNGTDGLAALELDAPSNGRTTSFAATMDEKDARAINLQDQFSGAGKPKETPSSPQVAPIPDSIPVSSGTTVQKPQISQPNQ